MSEHKWIMYMHQPLPGAFDIERCTSVKDAKEKLEEYGENTGFHEQVTASLYAYSDEGWKLAEEYATDGCPFGYPDRLIERTKNGGMKVVNA